MTPSPSHDEANTDDQDGSEWAAKNTHLEPEDDVDPIYRAQNIVSDLDEQGYASDWRLVACEEEGLNIATLADDALQ